MKKISQSLLTNTIITQRKALNMTQAQLAEATGINRTMLSHLESGEYMPSIPQLEALAETLSFDIVDLFEESDNRNSLPKEIK